MTTMTAVRAETKCRTLEDYGCCQIPVGWHVVSLKQTTKEWNQGNPRRLHVSHGPSNQLVVPVPALVWAKILEGLPVFGLRNLYVVAPKEAFYQKRVDPLIVGKVEGRWYFVAAWNLPEELK